MNAKIAAHVGINPYQTLATTHTREITMNNNHILIIEYVKHDRRCAELSIENYRAEIKEGSVLFEYKMSKSVERFDGGTTLGRKVAIDYMENNFGYVLLFVEEALTRWFDSKDESRKHYSDKFHPLDLPDSIQIGPLTNLDNVLFGFSFWKQKEMS